jgi:phosphorylase/glycogen(starch) synthase
MQLKPDYIFEVSWEVCNKVGGIHTVLCTKSRLLQQEWGDRLVLIGPDLSTASGTNTEFVEDKSLWPVWKEKMIGEGLSIRTGRWNIPGNPLVILIDFTPLFRQKNEIFTDLWVKYHLDSLNGQWDYIEPACFGYSAGKAIECFYRCHLNSTDRIVAQFHEWMTGAGILFLEQHAPQVATVFTTHATVIGRAIAGAGQPFYSSFDAIRPEAAAKAMNVISKHSLERLSAATADCFTSVSEFTSRECEQFLGKRPDFITPNGFDASFVPAPVVFNARRAAARNKVLTVASALLQQALPEDSLLVIKSGRYEFRNKGIDIFIDSLALLNNDTKLSRTVLAVIFVPASQTGPRKLLEDSLQNPDFSRPRTGEILTHNLQGAETDPVVHRIRQLQLDNSPGSHIKVLFVPTYLNGDDGIFNMTYYDILVGFDLAVFPSYYEPWGYTPLESLAFHIPAVTTSVSGFGAAVRNLPDYSGEGVFVVERKDGNEKEVAFEIAGIIRNYAALPPEETEKSRSAAAAVSVHFRWDNLLYRYKMAYDFALQKTAQREQLFRDKPQAQLVASAGGQEQLRPWRSIDVQPGLPPTMQALRKISENLWWSWNADARELFSYIDPAGWERSEQNPLVLLKQLDLATIRRLEKDENFLNRLSLVEQAFDRYMGTPLHAPQIAYFSMEFGVQSALKLYAGGLGVLAGDYLKAASDAGMNLVAVGLLFRHGYFKQRISLQHEQQTVPDTLETGVLPVFPVTDENGGQRTLPLPFPGRTVHAAIWRVAVGKVMLYLLDTDLPLNSPEDRQITASLYSGSADMRLKQEILLGAGGVRTLSLLGIEPDVYHINEGHAAFTAFARVHQIVHHEHLGFDKALEMVRCTTLFTTHTAEAAAHDLFDEELLRTYFAWLAKDLNVDWAQMMALGQAPGQYSSGKFSMIYFACNISQEINAVSRQHREISRRFLQPLWKEFRPAELHIGYVTNGVHVPTWAAENWREVDAGKISAVQAWEIHTTLKKKLIRTIRKRLLSRLASMHEDPARMMRQLREVNENALFVGFSRRFTPYKRAHLLFSDMQRLASILNNSKRPVQIIVAGKAHPEDAEGKAILKQVLTASSLPEIGSRVLFLEDYDMALAAEMVQGVDLWLNTPRRGKEASGTSGMKAALNGVLQLSAKEGWWAEAFDRSAGWALDADERYDNDALQDQHDATLLYSMLENEIIPLFFDRSQDGLPEKWIAMMKAAICRYTTTYGMERPVGEYSAAYRKLYDRSLVLKKDDYKQLHELVAWKKKMIANWGQLHVMGNAQPAGAHAVQKLGDVLRVKITLYTGELSAEEIGVEIVFSEREDSDGYIFTQELALGAVNGSTAVFEADVSLSETGTYTYSFRIFPKHILLPHRQDLPLLMWI